MQYFGVEGAPVFRHCGADIETTGLVAARELEVSLSALADGMAHAQRAAVHGFIGRKFCSRGIAVIGRPSLDARTSAQHRRLREPPLELVVDGEIGCTVF